MKQAFLAASVLLAGCSELAGLDELTVVEEGYLSGPVCGTCIEKRCAKTLGTCAASMQCSQVLARRRKARTPEEHFLASHQAHDSDVNWSHDAGTEGNAARPTDRAVADCARRECYAECSIGQDWGCVGGYAWDRPDRDEPLHIRHRVFGGGKWVSSVAQADVQVCTWDGSSCDPTTLTTDAGGRLETTLDDAFDYYNRVALRIDADGHPPHVVFGLDKPRYTGEYTAQTIYSFKYINDFTEPFFAAWDPERAYVTVGFTDCSLLGADELGLEVELVTAAGLATCPDPDCRVVPVGSDRTKPTGLMKLMSTRPEPGKAQQVRITARLPDTGQVVAKTSLRLEAGRLHGVTLTPLELNE